MRFSTINNAVSVSSFKLLGPYSQSTRKVTASVNVPERLRFAKFCIHKGPANKRCVIFPPNKPIFYGSSRLPVNIPETGTCSLF